MKKPSSASGMLPVLKSLYLPCKDFQPKNDWHLVTGICHLKVVQYLKGSTDVNFSILCYLLHWGVILPLWAPTENKLGKGRNHIPGKQHIFFGNSLTIGINTGMMEPHGIAMKIAGHHFSSGTPPSSPCLISREQVIISMEASRLRISRSET